ncbi:hypothetical protein [Roseovarius aestuarii]|uniref:hypothetical protein n=1 Tax=Roseovarius aestuarii TaxID=475083 RepID=UPI001CBDEFE8|nr:hypothetical protein [Roseovarius aestuarii]
MDRQLSHVKYLVLAVAFARANKWAVALSHAKRALAIINRSKNSTLAEIRNIPVKANSGSHITGREAYYFCAVATRILATNQRRLDTAIRYSEDAKLALVRDHKEGTGNKSNGLKFFCGRPRDRTQQILPRKEQR